VPELSRPDGIHPADTVTNRPVERAARTVKARHGGFDGFSGGGFVRGVAAPVRAAAGFLGMPGPIERAVAGIIPTLGGAGPDKPWSARHHDAAVAGESDQAATVPPGVTPR
jgi:hypothetical protein